MQTTTEIDKVAEVIRGAKIARVSSSLITGRCKSEKIICFAVLLIFLTFIHNSEEFSFLGFGGGDDNDLQSDIVEKMLSKKRTAMHKFKFHKLERSQNVHDNGDDDDNDDDDDDNNNNHKINDDADSDDDNDNNERNDDEDDDNDGDGDENDNDANANDAASKRSYINSKHHNFMYARKKNIHETAKHVKNKNDNIDDDDVDEDDDEDDDDEDEDDDDDDEKYHFKKARVARKTITHSSKKKNNDDDDDDDDGDDDDDDDNNEESYSSWLYNMILDWFGKIKVKESDNDDDSTVIESSNAIIKWLIWLRDNLPLAIKDYDGDEVNGDNDNNGESWLEYLNRWPFNSLFPIGNQGKPIKMPKIPKIKRTATVTTTDDDDDDDDDRDDDDDEDENLLDYGVPLFAATLLDDIEDNKCRRQLEAFHEQLNEHKLWTLQMLDSTAKVTTGLLRGSINQFGDFSMCINVRATVKVESSDHQSIRIRGKYCLAHIEMHASDSKLRLPVYMLHGRGLIRGHLGNPNHFIPRFGVINVGICVPHSCSAETVQKIMESKLEPYNSTGVEMHMEIDDNDCYIEQNKNIFKIFQKDKKFAATLIYFLGLALLLATSMISDYRSRLKYLINKLVFYIRILIKMVQRLIKKNEESEKSENDNNVWINEQIIEEENMSIGQDQMDTDMSEMYIEGECYIAEQLSFGALAEKVFSAFSPIRTYKTLLAYDVQNSQFSCLAIVKLSATIFLYLNLKFLMLGHLPITNRDEMAYSFEKSWSILFRNPLIYSDALLLICGFLAGYKLSEEMEQKSQINLLKRMALNVSRYLPTLHLFICFQTWILPYLNAAPLWTNIIGENARLCEEQWWRNMFCVQNAIDFEDMCSPATIQVALEIQLYLLGPLIVWLYYTNTDVAFFTYGALHAFSIAARYSYTKHDHLSVILFHGINVSKILRTASNLYMSPISRATPYLLGIGAGILQKTSDGILDITPQIERLGWILALLGLWWSLWSPSNGVHADYIYNASEAASYAAWCPLIFGLSLCWLLFMLPKNNRPFVQSFITSRSILILSRLIFPIQLVMFLMVLYNTASVTESIKFHITNLMNISEISCILLGAIILAFLIDIPNKKVRYLLINIIFSRRLTHEKDDAETNVGSGSGTEMSDASEEAVSEQHVEPIETIWSNDPEEEEQRFLLRRASLLNYSNANKLDENVQSENEEESEAESETEEDQVKVSKQNDDHNTRASLRQRYRPNSEN